MLAYEGPFPATRRTVVAMTIAVLALTMTEPPAGFAGTAAPRSSGVSEAAASSDATDFSSARRRRHVRRGNSNAAGLAFMGMAIGTIGAIAAQQRATTTTTTAMDTAMVMRRAITAADRIMVAVGTTAVATIVLNKVYSPMEPRLEVIV